jgi:hypothetical protein
MNILEIENQHTALFNKRNVVSISENEMVSVDGGSTLVCAGLAGVLVSMLYCYLTDDDNKK